MDKPKEEKTEKAKKLFLEWTEVIDKCLETEPDEKEGAFRFLSKDTFLRNIVLSSSRNVNEVQLKNFFDMEILNLYEVNKSRVTHKTIEGCLRGTLEKKYRFHLDLLSEYADEERMCEVLAAKVELSELAKEPERIKKAMYGIPCQLLLDWKESAAYSLENYWKKACTYSKQVKEREELLDV